MNAIAIFLFCFVSWIISTFIRMQIGKTHISASFDNPSFAKWLSFGYASLAIVNGVAILGMIGSIVFLIVSIYS